MFSPSATALSAIFGFVSLAAALPTEISARDLPPISFVPNPSVPTYCEIGLQFDQSGNNNVGLTIWDHNGAVLGNTQTTGGTNHFNFDSQLPSVFVVDVPKSFSKNDISGGLTALKWGYGKHKGGYNGIDYINCGSSSDWDKHHTCWVSFDCSN